MINRRQWVGGTAIVLSGWKAGVASAQTEDGFPGLRGAFARIEATCGGRLGVAVLDTGSGQRTGHRQDERFPLTSTFKVLLAGAVLARVDAGRDSLDRRIRFAKDDLVAWSPVTETAVGGDGMTLAALCEAIMTISDNTAANLLLRVTGGPEGLTAHLRSLGDDVTRLDRIETTLNEARPGDPRDTTTPAAMLETLRTLTLGTALSPASRGRLVGWMRANRTGDTRLRAKLPPSWQVADRTGGGGHNTSNVIGLLWPPEGRAPLVVTAYLTEGPAEGAVRDAALAEVGAAIAAASVGNAG
jgi:beta-lactamase class A